MKRKISVICLLCISFVILGASYSEKVLQDINDSGIVRLHIVANSNDKDDQELKLRIRDELLLSGVMEDEREDVLMEITEICNKEIKKSGKSYLARAEIGKFYFPTKEYKNIKLPAGNYNALKVTLGEGVGENWWCVISPPLCFSKNAFGEISEEDEKKLKNILKKESYEIISSDELVIVPAFKTVEIWQKIVNKFNKIKKAT